MSHPPNHKLLSSRPIIFSSYNIVVDFPMEPLVTMKLVETTLYARAVVFIDSSITDRELIRITVSDDELSVVDSYSSSNLNPPSLLPWLIEHKCTVASETSIFEQKLKMTLVNDHPSVHATSNETITRVPSLLATLPPTENLQNLNCKVTELFTDVVFGIGDPSKDVPIGYPIAPFVAIKNAGGSLYIRALVFIEKIENSDGPSMIFNDQTEKEITLFIDYYSTNNDPSTFTAWMLEYECSTDYSIDQVQTILWNTDPKTSRGTHTLVPDPKLPQAEDVDA